MCPWNHPDRFTLSTTIEPIFSEFSANVVLGSEGSCCRVEAGLELPECHRLKSLLVKTKVVCTSPESESRGSNDCSHAVCHGEVGNEESGSASIDHEFVLLLTVEVSGAELTLIVQ